MSSSEQFLPQLDAAVLSRQYKFSGQTPQNAYIYMLLGLLLSPIANIVAWILFMLLLMVVAIGVAILAIIPLVVTQLFAILVMLMMALAVLFSPAIVGAAVGYVEAYIGRRGKCRNPVIGGVMGAISGFVGALPSLIILALVMTLEALESSPDEVVTPVAVLIGVFSCASILFAAGGAVGGYWGIKEVVFCEDCDTWYGSWSSGVGYGIDLLRLLARALNTKIDQPLGYTGGPILEGERPDPMVGEQYPNVVLRTRKCPNCPGADVQWKATINWKSDKSQDWFVIMLPAEFSSQLEGELFTT